MRKQLAVRIYCEAIFVCACLIVVLLSGQADFGFVLRSPATFGILAVGVFLGEMMPLKVPRRGDHEEITLSSAFALALLLMGGVGPALIAQVVACVLQDLSTRRPAWRIRFNAGQYVVSMAAADVFMRALSATPGFNASQPFHSGQLAAMVLGVGVFFVVNTLLVGVAVALYMGVTIPNYFKSDLGFVVLTGGAMVLISPIVLATAVYSVFLVPLCMAPVVVIHNSIARSARSEHAARHDSLTGLPNRAAFNEAVERVIGDNAIPAAVLLLDLDRFKEVNDTLGHHYGDMLLVAVARRFCEAIGDDAVIARLGGDEFAIVAAAVGAAQATELGQRVGEALTPPFELDHMLLDVQASIGIALFPAHGSAVETLLQKADVAMYRAKEARTSLAVYDEEHDHHSPAKLSLTAELRAAVAGSEIVPWFQPEIEMTTGRVVAVEALARWQHPSAGLLVPGAFVRLAEHTNLIKPLTHRIIECALAELATWRAAGHEIVVAVNVSPQVLVDRSFTQHVVGALERAQVPAHLLKIEVTEGALMADPVVAAAVLGELSALGVEISIDDFGTGYSSLAYIADLPVREVKIDRSFVSSMSSVSGKRVIVSSTIDLAHHLGLRTVAEGVSDLSLLPHLEQLGCDIVQGFALGRPMPGAELLRWLESFDAAVLGAGGRGQGEPGAPVRRTHVADLPILEAA